MKKIDSIIRDSIFISTLMVSAVIVGIQSFLSLVQQINFVGQQGFGLWQALLYVLMQLPAQFYQLFPIAGFLGALIGLSRLSSTSQLIVMRVSGISMIQIAWSVMKTAIIIIFVVTLLGEGVGPLLQQQSEQLRQNELFPRGHAAILESVWLRQGNGFIRIGRLTGQHAMMDVTRYYFEPSGRLSRASVATSAQWINGQWKLLQLKKTIFHPDHIEVQSAATADLHVAFEPELQEQMSLVTAEQTIKDLYHTIHYRRSIGLGVSQYVFTLWQRILQPLTTVVMICLAVPFVFGSFRSASMGLRILAGVFIGFTFYMLNQLFGPITLVYQFPPLLAAVMPTCLFLMIAMLLLVRAR